MPQFRKLHTKIIDSLDVDAMSNDFVRLTWTWLQLIACKEGRGMMHGGWLKSKLYPLRADVTPEMLTNAMHEFYTLGMITLYSVDGRDYFQINKWKDYQNTAREAPSQYPEPTQELVMSYSGVNHEEVKRTSSYLIYSMSDLNGDEKSEITTILANICRNAGTSDIKTLDLADWLIEQGAAVGDVVGFGEWYSTHSDSPLFLKSVKTFWPDYVEGKVPHFSKKKTNSVGTIDGLLANIRDGQTAGVDVKTFKGKLTPEELSLFDALGMTWADIKRLTIKQTDDLRFRLQGVKA